MQQRKPKLYEASFTIVSFAVVMFVSIIFFKTSPHIPMLIGCAIAAAVAMKTGFTWKTVEDGMLKGITQALTSLIILMLIGILIGVWIQAGVVPTMIYYGLKLLSPKFFLVSTMVICSIISMAVGSWGTAGTIGLAFMGISHALEIPAPMAAGAIISGAYLGDKISPLSDSTNLASAVTGVDIFSNVRHMFPVAGSVYLVSGVIYTVIGFRYGRTAGDLSSVRQLMENLDGSFYITPLNILPLVFMVICVLMKVPSIPCIFLGILAAGVQGVLLQQSRAAQMLHCAFYGYRSETGNKMMDSLLSAGGLESMMFSVSMIICAMMFGGIMERTGQMEALMEPILRHMKGGGGLIGATVISCVGINLILPEQYIAIAIPGRMFAEEYDRHGIDRKELTRALGAGGASVSPLVPWNTCGVYMAGVLGVSTILYGRYVFLNIMMPIATILVGLIKMKSVKPAAHKQAM